MPNAVADIFRQAADLNTGEERRRGSVVYLGEDCDLVVTGDLHGNRDALAKIIKYSDLSQNPSRRLILQEIIHGPIDPRTGHDRSIEVLLRAARLKIAHPRQVLFLLGNHDVAEITDNEISRDGQPSCKTFASGLNFTFPQAAGEITAALEDFVLSLPLAVRCPNAVLISHSLPTPAKLNDKCFEILDRPYRMEDLHRGGAAYEWTWGRRHTPELVDTLSERLAIELFIIGHLHVPGG